MTDSEIRETLARLGRGVQLAELPDGELASSLDSVQRLSLVVAIEDHFHVVFSPEDEERIRTVDELVAAIGQKLAGA